MSKTIKIDILNSLGIIEFKHNFEFDDKSNFYGLYAQNGTMKSSFARTLQSYSKGESISDRLFRIPGSCTVDGISPTDIISFPSFSGRAEICSEAASLVANNEVKEEYDRALSDVIKAYDTFVMQLAEATKTSTTSGIDEIVSDMYRSFVSEEVVETITIPHIVQLLKSIRTEVQAGNIQFCDIGYKRFISLNFKKFINNKKYQGLFADLANAYDEFRATPTYYRNGFDASSAQKLIKAMSESKYFDASHEVILKDNSGKDGGPILSVSDLEKHLKTDFDLIIEQYPHLKTPLNQLIADFSVGTNGDVRKIFEDNSKRDLLLFMGSEDRFYKNMWYGYLLSCSNEVEALIAVFDEASANIKNALDKADTCENAWEVVVNIFNDRFSDLPYKIHIVNKRDAIVHDLIRPVFEIRYRNPRNPASPYRERPDESSQLRTIGSILSNGECKALYLLNVIFQLRSKLGDGMETLAIFDDIVESFDYKNKYAFFEYLQELTCDYPQLYIVVLTHNFDFFRLVYEKIYPRNADQFKIITKTKDSKLGVTDMFDPRVFGSTKKVASSDKSAWIALIPFARNLVEFRSDSTNHVYEKFTRCLHVMADKPTIGDIVTDICNNVGVVDTPFDHTLTVHDAIIETARKIANSNEDDFDLHKNITLAIGIRLVIERYIISKLSVEDYVNAQARGNNQTRELIKRYKNNTSDTNKEKKVRHFNGAAMMVDGSIHLNSFMYEPLIDMGTWELKDMFNETERLLI